jgi:hypothetical protein
MAAHPAERQQYHEQQASTAVANYVWSHPPLPSTVGIASRVTAYATQKLRCFPRALADCVADFSGSRSSTATTIARDASQRATTKGFQKFSDVKILRLWGGGFGTVQRRADRHKTTLKPLETSHSRDHNSFEVEQV